MTQNKQSILFISGLDKSVNESELYKQFNEFPVSYIKIAKDHQTRESFGYAFVGFKSQLRAEEALNKYNYEKLPNHKKTMRICWYNRDPLNNRNNPNYNIFVKKIPKSVSHKEFHNHFAQFGNIISAKLAEDEDGEVIGYGFVMYDSVEAADKAINQTHEKEFHGKKLWCGKFVKNKPKKPAEYNNIYVKNIPKEYSEDKIKSIFSQYGELGSVLVRDPKENIDSKIPEDKRKNILNHKFAFICFKNPENAKKAVSIAPFRKLSDNAFNEKLEGIVSTISGLKRLPEEHHYRFATYLIENKENPNKILSDQVSCSNAIEEFQSYLKEHDDNYLVKDKTDRVECHQALKKKEREKKVKAIYEKIKKQIKEKYRLCNLYVKNLPDSFDDESLRSLFEPYGEIRSCKTTRKELLTSYLGIRRSVKVFGYVCFADKSAAHEAKKALHDKPLNNTNTKLYVDYHQSKNERTEFLKLNMINKSNKVFQKGGKFEMGSFPGMLPRNIPHSNLF